MTGVADQLFPHAQRPMRADARRNYERILKNAHVVFSESGTDASLEEIARRAEVGAGTLYRHFPSREDLLVAVMHNGFADLHRRALELRTSPDPAAALEEYFAFWLQQTTTYKGVAAAVMNQSLESERPWASRCHLAQEDSQFLLQRAQDAGAIRSDITHKEIWRLLNGVVIGVKDANVSRDEAQSMFDIILRGLRA